MSEPTVSGGPPKAPGKKYAGLTRNQWLIAGAVGTAALVWIVWKRHKAAAAAAAGTGTAGTASSECTDASGNTVPCDQADTSGELSALQTELETLMAQEGQSGGGSGGGGVTTVPVDTGTGPAGTPPPPASTTPVTSTGGTATATAARAGAISNLQASGETTSSAKVSWNVAPGATGGYSYKVDQLNGANVKQGITKATSVTVSNLHPGWTYNFGIQALPGGPGNNIHFSTKSK